MGETSDKKTVDAVPATGSPDRNRKISGVFETLWYVSLAVLFGLVAVGALAATAAVAPISCSVCHGSQVDSLESGRHATVHCDSCHVQPGPFGLIDNRLRVAAMVPVQLVPGGYASAHVSNASCLGCHEDMLSETIVVNGIRMNHRAPEQDGWLCTSCHSSVGHPSGEGRAYGEYSMDTCLECHLQKADNLSGCETCHPEGERRDRSTGANTPWRVAHGPQWRSLHGMGDLETCKACHGSAYCSACHTIGIPHPSGFLGKHGASAMESEQSIASCQDCHDPVVCQGCHGVDMPHPVEFLQSHSELVEEAGDETCFRCHEQTNCDACHTRHAHPGLDTETREKLTSRPVKVD